MPDHICLRDVVAPNRNVRVVVHCGGDGRGRLATSSPRAPRQGQAKLFGAEHQNRWLQGLLAVFGRIFLLLVPAHVFPARVQVTFSVRVTTTLFRRNGQVDPKVFALTLHEVIHQRVLTARYQHKQQQKTTSNNQFDNCTLDRSTAVVLKARR